MAPEEAGGSCVTPSAWVALSSLVISVLVAMAMRAYHTGSWVTTRDTKHEELERKVERMEEQFERMENLLNGFEHQMRQIFVTKELSDERQVVAQHEREYVRAQLSNIQREVQNLATAMHKDFKDLRQDFLGLLNARRERDKSGG